MYKTVENNLESCLSDHSIRKKEDNMEDDTKMVILEASLAFGGLGMAITGLSMIAVGAYCKTGEEAQLYVETGKSMIYIGLFPAVIGPAIGALGTGASFANSFRKNKKKEEQKEGDG